MAGSAAAHRRLKRCIARDQCCDEQLSNSERYSNIYYIYILCLETTDQQKAASLVVFRSDSCKWKYFQSYVVIGKLGRTQNTLVLEIPTLSCLAACLDGYISNKRLVPAPFGRITRTH